MTKRRGPLTFERAIATIAGLIGWDKAAAVVGKSVNAVRAWSDEDVAAGIRLDAALALDCAYRLAGGDGYPLLQVYATRVETDAYTASPDTARLHALIAKVAKEGGEAIEAAIEAAQPGADDRLIARAELELEESIAVQTNTLRTLRAGRLGDVQSERGPEGNGPCSSPGRG